MAIGGINSPYSLFLPRAGTRYGQPAGQAISITNWQAETSAAKTPSASLPAPQAANAAAPPELAEMAEQVENTKQEIEAIMRQAREVSGFNGPLSHSGARTLYGVGPYSEYDEETKTWQWYNEDGSTRSGQPTDEETVQQIRVSAEKRKVHEQYLIDNGAYEMMQDLARDATILDLASQSKNFRDAYLADPEAAQAKNSGILSSRKSHFNYSEKAGGAAGFGGKWHGAQPLVQLQSLSGMQPGEIQRIDLAEVLRTAEEGRAAPLDRLAKHYSGNLTEEDLHWWQA